MSSQIEEMAEGNDYADDPCHQKCNRNFKPVCGDDGNDYTNHCMMKCRNRNVKKLCMGFCPCPACKCTREINPVCGAGDRTYDNLCMAECRGARVKYKGKCGSPRGRAAA